MRRPIVFALCFVLFGCGSGVSGTYSNAMGIEVAFKNDGTALVTTPGGAQEMTYTVDGDSIKIKSPSGTQVYTRRPDGSLVSGNIRLAPGTLAENRKKQTDLQSAAARQVQ